MRVHIACNKYVFSKLVWFAMSVQLAVQSDGMCVQRAAGSLRVVCEFKDLQQAF